MPRKDLTAYFKPDLELPWRDGVFVCRPPSKDAGLKLAAINAVGVQAYIAGMGKCPTCGHIGKLDLPQSTLDLLEAIDDEDPARIALGTECYDQMVAAGVPGPDIDMMGMYALYYWTLGEETADQIMAATAGDGAGKAPQASATSTPRPGPRTGSGTRTKQGSTRATGASRRR